MIVVYLLLGLRRVLMKKNGEATEGRGCIVKYGETPFGGGGLVRIAVNI